MLKVDGIGKSFGGLRALQNVSFGVREGEIKGVIGPNGAGKSTLFHIITGILRPTQGRVELNHRVISGLAATAVARHGVARTFQQPQTLRTFTVLDNVMLGLEAVRRTGALSCGLGLRRARDEEQAMQARALEQLRFVGMAERAQRIASELPLGEQRYVEIARALATDPAVLLLDEPAAGLNDSETDSLMALLQRVRDKGITILLIEHHMKFVMSLCDSIVVLNFGQKLAEGTPGEIQRSPEVIGAYLGEADHFGQKLAEGTPGEIQRSREVIGTQQGAAGHA